MNKCICLLVIVHASKILFFKVRLIRSSKNVFKYEFRIILLNNQIFVYAKFLYLCAYSYMLKNHSNIYLHSCIQISEQISFYFGQNCNCSYLPCSDCFNLFSRILNCLVFSIFIFILIYCLNTWQLKDTQELILFCISCLNPKIIFNFFFFPFK